MKASHPEAVAASRANPGETLRLAREGNGWKLGDVAHQLNLTEHALRQLEAGAFEQLPGHTFARGYIRAYAKLLGMDQNRLVAEFDQYTGTDAKGSDVHSLGRIEEPVRLSQSVLRVVSFFILVALIGAAFFWWQEQSQRRAGEASNTSLEHVEVESADGTTQIHPLDEPEDQAVVEAETEATPPVTELPLDGTTPDVATAPSTTPPATPTPSAAPPAVTPPSVPQPVVPTPAPSSPAAAAPAAAPEAPVELAAGQARIDIRFVADCWTQVSEVGGKVLFSGLKRTGETLQLVGKAPLELRLGYARGAQVSYNGQAVDLAASTHGETARLKLGQ
ncbi:RodZ family helix-turn-helix domain-containing protein [Pseudomonas sp. RIT-PI-AD]|uniref:RodZ domain-containing protein n=1 Tax=Pseudomonas sp. RIT-PI-AD TaxID=3035294 RepID=UPI0021D87278|nr:RodZ family helix-turn-helix domain-containing protein [Pseudomonas sp. RIT-PI-AD]